MTSSAPLVRLLRIAVPVCCLAVSALVHGQFVKLADFPASAGAGLDANAIRVNGVIYGTSERGGKFGFGTLFRYDGATGFRVLHHFGNPKTDSTGTVRIQDGERPSGQIVLQGNTIFGATRSGGLVSLGTLFKINTDGSGYQVLYRFGASPTEGIFPQGGVAIDGKYLYGTTEQGGSFRRGTVFSMSVSGEGFRTLHSFDGSTGGGSPMAPVVVSNGTIYGTAALNGVASTGYTGYGSRPGPGGVIFSLSTGGDGFTIMHRFREVSNDGYYPTSGLSLVGSRLFGVTNYGGDYQSTAAIGGPAVPPRNGGVLFSIEKDGTAYRKLHDFGSGIDADGSAYGLVANGSTLYGTSLGHSGTSSGGAIYTISSDGTGYSVLCRMSAVDGRLPMGPLWLQKGVLYGFCADGGTSMTGTIYQFTLP